MDAPVTNAVFLSADLFISRWSRPIATAANKAPGASQQPSEWMRHKGRVIALFELRGLLSPSETCRYRATYTQQERCGGKRCREWAFSPLRSG
jgi:hypothetical protein